MINIVFKPLCNC